jgi:hypothetical protein
MYGRAGTCVHEVESEITIRNRINAVRRQTLESKRAAHGFPLEGKGGGRQRSRAERHLAS